jgi:hypothetical protein
MKRLFIILMAGLALVMAHDFNGAYVGAQDGEVGGIPLSKLAGKYAFSGQGTITVCFKPGFSATEACSTEGAVGAPGNEVDVGQFTEDKNGNTCGTLSDTFGFPGSPFPTTAQVQHVVGKVTSYDSATGSGDESNTTYIGGKCIGAEFDSTGATVFGTSTGHLVASKEGKRIDSVVTAIPNPIIGAFNLSGVAFKQ